MKLELEKNQLRAEPFQVSSLNPHPSCWLLLFQVSSLILHPSLLFQTLPELA